MATDKKHYYIFGLVGIGSLLILYFLWTDSQGAATVGGVSPSPGSPQYPTSPEQPIPTGGDIIVNAPPATLYNVPMDGAALPTVKVGTAQSACGCSDNDCDSAGVPVSVQTIDSKLIDSMWANVQSFTQLKGSA